MEICPTSELHRFIVCYVLVAVNLGEKARGWSAPHLCLNAPIFNTTGTGHCIRCVRSRTFITLHLENDNWPVKPVFTVI